MIFIDKSLEKVINSKRKVTIFSPSPAWLTEKGMKMSSILERKWPALGILTVGLLAVLLAVTGMMMACAQSPDTDLAIRLGEFEDTEPGDFIVRRDTGLLVGWVVWGTVDQYGYGSVFYLDRPGGVRLSLELDELEKCVLVKPNPTATNGSVEKHLILDWNEYASKFCRRTIHDKTGP